MRNNWKEEYGQLNQKYIELFGKLSELEYQYNLLENETKQRKNQEGEVKKLHQNVRQLKHDMKNHLMVITSYINDEEYDKVKEYTSEILGKLSSMHSYVETGNILLNHIINEKFQLAKKEGILIKAEIENLQFRKLSSMDFSSLLYNVLDNAIEACKREEEGKKEIQIMITKNRGYETIFVRNRIEVSVLDHNPKLESKKEDKNSHGYGMKKIMQILDSCDGLSDVYEEENFFCVRLFVPE